MTRAGDRRRREFTTVRALARQALARIDVAPAPILPGPKGQPRWAPGVRGSMTHCAGYRAAVVARSRDGLGLGIDAEPNGPLSKDALAAITTGDEAAHIAALRDRAPQVHWDRLLFSAKEAVYKTWFPLTGARLGFRDAHITFHPGTGRFVARLSRSFPDVPGAGRLRRLTGRWAASDTLVVTAICLPAARPAGRSQHKENVQ
ncbi:4'-phosphopantetheinyl transferase [Streptomyces purpureus]|uniref:4'-phosphopantetheinyl transferase family protein n=1 Tax=Streptomyces purpureus TaxID=1951 RepID=UPI001FD518AC|nr:4'-phosphopantetheinyl transferase superfamily protein [Streptomyces purpureus]